MKLERQIWYCNGMARVFRVGVFLVAVILAQAAWGVSLTVNIEGLDQKLRAHVLTYLDISREQGNGNLTQARVQRLHERAPEQIKTALQVYGYYQARVKSDLRQEEQQWIATYSIELGDPIRIESVDLQVSGEGQNNPEIKAAVAKFPITKGQPLEQPRYDKARDALFRTAIEQGFLDAQFIKRELRVDLRNYTAAVILYLQTGDRYYFGPVSFNQNFLAETYLRGYVKFKPGDPYSPVKLLQLQTTLSDSGMFQSVDVKANRAQVITNQVPIEVTLSARKRRQWRFGLGYATDTEARASVNYNQIVGSEGDKFESRLLVSNTTKRFTAGYSIPLADPIKDQVGIGVHYSDETINDRESLVSGLTVSHTTAWGEWQRVISLNYDREVYTIASEPQETGRALYPVYSLTRIRADNRLYTRHGSRIYLELRGANKNILSDTNYVQLRAGLKWIRGLGEDNRILLRGDFGSTNVASLSSMPLSQRFFAGGDNSVRGYGYQELGPKDAFGYVVGGKHLIVGSVELEHRLSGNWSTAIFYDVGNAINSMSDPLVAGAGFGMRWNSPVGPVRFDFAWALDKPTDRFRLHVVIGPDL
jgi:translocation and assembly module TamA